MSAAAEHQADGTVAQTGGRAIRGGGGLRRGGATVKNWRLRHVVRLWAGGGGD